MQANQYRREDSYYSFLQRQSKTATAIVFPIGAGGFATASLGVDFALGVDQALKLVSADGFAADPLNTGKIIVVQASIAFATAIGGVGRGYQGAYAGTAIGANGYNIHASDQEWFFWNDYSESDGSVGNDIFSVGFDFQNTDVAAQSATIGFSAIVELYEKQKIGLGQQATLRTLREIP